MADWTGCWIVFIPEDAQTSFVVADGNAAIHNDVLTGDESAGAHRQHHRHACDIADLADASQRRGHQPARQQVAIAENRLGEAGTDHAGRDGVHAHIRPPPLHRQIARQLRCARLWSTSARNCAATSAQAST